MPLNAIDGRCGQIALERLGFIWMHTTLLDSLNVESALRIRHRESDAVGMTPNDPLIAGEQYDLIGLGVGNFLRLKQPHRR